jgi:ABC-type nitrate/sulfonate/bicarbonate transport system permease component
VRIGRLISIASLVAILLILIVQWFEAEAVWDFAKSAGEGVVGVLAGFTIGRLIGFWIDYQPKDKRTAKRFNESVKLAANSVNAVALGVIGAAVIVPLIRPEEAVGIETSRLL